MVGITDQRDAEIFCTVIQSLVSREKNLRLKRGELRVEELASNCASFEELVASAENLSDPCIEFEFKSPTCIVYRNSKAFEMFPHREAVFFSLLSKWNSVCPEELKMDIERDEMRRFIAEKPLVYKIQSAVISMVFDRAKGQARPIIRQGFVGSCWYTFTRDAPEKVQKGIVALARFVEYSGVCSSMGSWLRSSGGEGERKGRSGIVFCFPGFRCRQFALRLFLSCQQLPLDLLAGSAGILSEMRGAGGAGLLQRREGLETER